jgi:riboflavin synthase
MFTGIVEELGRFVARGPGERARFAARTVLEDSRLGDSIAVNGCCLTLVEQGDGWWEADLSDETLRRTTLGALRPGDPVNLERPLRLSDRLGGHLVQGHVDAVGTVVAPAPDLRVRIPGPLRRYCVEKGSMTVDGVSLTIVDVLLRDGGGTGEASRSPQDGAPFEVSFAIIPHTAEVTTLGHRRPGEGVNIEADVMAKHVEQLLGPYAATLRPPG